MHHQHCLSETMRNPVEPRGRSVGAWKVARALAGGQRVRKNEECSVGRFHRTRHTAGFAESAWGACAVYVRGFIVSLFTSLSILRTILPPHEGAIKKALSFEDEATVKWRVRERDDRLADEMAVPSGLEGEKASAAKKCGNVASSLDRV
ncbi:putative signal transduction protein GarA [Anopheles sinensis]|uniref:Putative signal transduction protein GarA n=1 Tax=Anopheles sinensis TaxID=74873 RepID=A0A084WAN0_ANOSI|nr:putative signal transduction protein GarA [Anopheles sinensis]